MCRMTQKQGSQKKVLDTFEVSHVEILKKSQQLEDVLTRLRYEGRMSFGRNVKELGALLHFLNEDLKNHVTQEERVLFPYVESHIPKLEPVINLLRSEHQEFKKNLKTFESRL